MIVTAPEYIPTDRRKQYWFLGGTIDMGSSRNWQLDFCKKFGDTPGLIILNPRRKEWDETWVQNYGNPIFYQQVNWELNALEKADVAIFNFLEGSKSPITFLELGKYANKAIVICPVRFYRYGNIQIFCERNNIPLYNSEEQFINNI
jgi:hypothetical protein